jgi:hypothetical protein
MGKYYGLYELRSPSRSEGIGINRDGALQYADWNSIANRLNEDEETIAALKEELKRYKNPPDDLRDRLAHYAHDVWCRWAGTVMANEGISDQRVARWRYFIETPFEQLTDDEKHSDYREADLILASMIGRPSEAMLREKTHKVLVGWIRFMTSKSDEECKARADSICAQIFDK